MNILNIDFATEQEFEAVVNILNYYKLITQDIDFKKQMFFVQRDEDLVCAVGAIELHQPYGLIRSIAVCPDKTKSGYARKIVKKLEEIAFSNELTKLYLLTETAELVFAKLGYESIGRESVPQIIKRTNQFSELCPASATVMVKSIIPSK